MRYKLISLDKVRALFGQISVDADIFSEEDIPSYAKFSNHQFVEDDDEQNAYNAYINELHPMFNWDLINDRLTHRHQQHEQWVYAFNNVLITSIDYTSI